MEPFALLASTTSHKREPLLPTLDVFARLGMRRVDLNLSHLFEGNDRPAAVAAAAMSNGQRLAMASGGWCDFYAEEPAIEQTFASVERQIAIARQLGIATLRLFYGRLPLTDYNPARLRTIAANISRLGACYPDVAFAFENHDGASLRPAVCREILEAVDRPNVRMNFDPINFARAGVDTLAALIELQPLVAHVHLKGCRDGDCCEFGSGDVDLTPVLRALVDGGYRGAFTVEYEGPFDRTVRLYESFRRAQDAIAGIVQASL